MTHPLAGCFSADESARLIRNYRYAVERMMRILGGWIALTPELSAKLLMGRHVWDNAQHADAFGRRLPELRAQAQVSEPASGAFVAVMDAIEAPELPGQTVERIVGVYDVLKAHLLASYEEHLGLTNEVYEPPTRRILARCAEDERRHIVAGRAILRHLVTTPALEERASQHKARLEALLAASGGVTGRGVPAPAIATPAPTAVAASDDARELIRLEQAGSGRPLPEDLGSAVERFGDALIARDPVGIRRSFLPGATPAGDVESVLAAHRLDRHRIVALAEVGRQRLVKLRVEGPDGSIALVARFVPAEGGWRAVAVDLVATDLTRPA